MISVYTPTFNTGDLLYNAYKCLLDQSYTDWEWIICDDGSHCENTKFILSIFEKNDKIKVHYFDHCGLIGLMKHRCVLKSSGDILVELDHDDLLTNNCLQEVYDAFRDESIGMVYSNFTEVDYRKTSTKRFNIYQGWNYCNTEYNGIVYKEAIAPDVYREGIIHNHGLVPNHVRAFRKSEVLRLGNYDKTLKYADDYDLIIRFYLHSKIFHIVKMLYIYRFGENTWLYNQKDLTKKMEMVHDRYFGSWYQRTVHWLKNSLFFS